MSTTEASTDAPAGTSPATDPRIDRRLRAALAVFELDGPAAPAPFGRDAGLDAIAEYLEAADAGFTALYANLPGGDDLRFTSHTIEGTDGNELVLRVFRPEGIDTAVPAVIYIHGGGMTILPTDGLPHLRWCQAMADRGVIAISADFRNAYTAEGRNPFPAGLDDCAACIDWVHANRSELGISKVVVQGESGGGNLALASTLKAKREGRLDAIDGVYASVPYISGGYGWDEARRAEELPSLVENNGMFLDCTMMDLLVAYYGGEPTDPLVWPYFASTSDLEGLPPHVISVNELDPLRDEGIAFYRKLLAAGVPTTGKVNLGIVHGAEMIFSDAIPDVHDAAVDDIVAFAQRI